MFVPKKSEHIWILEDLFFNCIKLQGNTSKTCFSIKNMPYIWSSIVVAGLLLIKMIIVVMKVSELIESSLPNNCGWSLVVSFDSNQSDYSGINSPSPPRKIATHCQGPQLALQNLNFPLFFSGILPYRLTPSISPLWVSEIAVRYGAGLFFYWNFLWPIPPLSPNQ